MDQQILPEIIKRLSEHIKVICCLEAPHSGSHNINFTSTEPQLKKFVKACNRVHAYVYVLVNDDEDVTYYASIASGNIELILEYLERNYESEIK